MYLNLTSLLLRYPSDSAVEDVSYFFVSHR